MVDLDTLALEAKNNNTAFEKLLNKMEGLCRSAAYRYSVMMEFDELLQMARIEVWNAVLSFQEGKMPFIQYCGLTVYNHIKSYIYRQNGPKHTLYRKSLRLNAPLYEDETTTLEGMIPATTLDMLKLLEKKESYRQLHQLLSHSLTELEYSCLVFFYYDEFKYKEIQDKLRLSNRKSVGNALERLRSKLSKNQELFDILSSICA